jgi:hypothetical protein
MKKYPDLRIVVAGGRLSVGIKSVATGEADIGTASREVKESEIKMYKDVILLTTGCAGWCGGYCQQKHIRLRRKRSINKTTERYLLRKNKQLEAGGRTR